MFIAKDAFVEQLRLVFGNVDETRITDRKVNAIRQKTSAADYTAYFQRIASQLEWDDAALCSRFFNRLKWEVKDDILRRESQPTMLARMIEIATKTDNRIYDSQLEKKGLGRQRTFAPNSAKKQNAPYYKLMPMEIDKLQKKNLNQAKGQGW